LTFWLIAGVVWLVLLLVIVALCLSAARGDAADRELSEQDERERARPRDAPERGPADPADAPLP